MAIDLNKPVQTRDGRKVRIVATDVKGVYPIIALVEADDCEDVNTYTADGYYFSGGDEETDDDLVNVVERVERYFEVFPAMHGYASKEEALAFGSGPQYRAGLVKITFEDGKVVSAEAA
jgi:hypothetical protein